MCHLPTSWRARLRANLIAVSDLTEKTDYSSRKNYNFAAPEIRLLCPDSACNGTRFFRFSDSYKPSIGFDKHSFIYVTYRCSNCQNYHKTFALAAKATQNDTSGECFKFGELPPFGPPTPTRLITLIGPDRDAFLKGRRCENQGLGIGAFAYYRRVIENQKGRILSEIKRVGERLGSDKRSLQFLDQAIAETQFSKAVDLAKDVIPPAIMVNGHNPLTLLHSALSKGLHNDDDQECLSLASSIRIVLADLAERLSQALKDEAELTQAINTLLKKQSSVENSREAT